MNATQIGNDRRNRTRKHFEALGYDVALAEQAKFCFFGGKMRVFKKDMFGADLIAINGKEIVAIQCKTTNPLITASKREFEKWKWPGSVRKIVACWKKKKNKLQIEITEI